MMKKSRFISFALSIPSLIRPTIKHQDVIEFRRHPKKMLKKKRSTKGNNSRPIICKRTK